jgi:SAM-dependent methyltransferase
MSKYIRRSLHRNLLEKQLTKLAPLVKGNILDAGSKNNPYEKFFNGHITAIDIEPKRKDVMKGDITDLKFKSNLFDTVISTEVFEYLEDPKRAISEICRVLKKNGVLLLSAPLIYRFHDDLVRYTENYWRKLLKDFSKVEFYYIGNFYTIILDILRDKIVKNPNILLRYLFYLPFLILTLLIPFSQLISKDRNFVSGYIIFAKK